MYETDYAVTLRTAASAGAVWDELRTLERLFENMSTVSSYEVDADGHGATFLGALTRWPAAWRSLPGRAEVVASEPPGRVVWSVTIPDIDLHFVGTFELAPVAAEETNLTYSGVLCCGHRLSGRLGRVLEGVLEAYMDDLVTRIASRAARRAAAEQALADA